MKISRLIVLFLLIMAVGAPMFSQEPLAVHQIENARLSEGSNSRVGIGLKIQQKRNYPWIFIREVMPGSPAEAAGLRQGDEITRINDMALIGKNIRQIARMISGPAGTYVQIQIKRGPRFMTYRIQRKILLL